MFDNVNLMIEEFYKVFYEIEELMLKQGIKCLTTTELHVIEAIGNSELTMNELSDKLGITMGTATVAVNKLNDKGIKEALQSGVLAGYKVEDVKVTLYDGSYHEVDSSEMAFKLAASMGFKQGCRSAAAGAVLLEPIMKVEIETPEDYMGDVIGDCNKRRGQVQSMDDRAGIKLVTAMIPLSEMFGYSTDLRSMSQGRATYSMIFDAYQEVPRNVSEEIMKKRNG